MKRTRMIVVIISVVLFFAVLLLGSNTVFSLTEFDISFNLESKQAMEDSQTIQREIEKRYKGKNILFVNENDTAKEFDNYPYLTVLSVEKLFPCTIKMTVEEKSELYAFEVEKAGAIVYCMTDKDGVVLRENAQNVNNVDEKENFAVYGLTMSAISDKSDKKFSSVLAFSNKFSDVVGGLRTCLKSVTFRETSSAENSHELEIETYEGIVIRIRNPYEYTEEKASAAANAYVQLSDGEKLFGELIVVNSVTEEGKILVNRVDD